MTKCALTAGWERGGKRLCYLMALSQLGRVYYGAVGEGLCSAPGCQVGYRAGEYFADASRGGLGENKINMLAFRFHVETKHLVATCCSVTLRRLML